MLVSVHGLGEHGPGSLSGTHWSFTRMKLWSQLHSYVSPVTTQVVLFNCVHGFGSHGSEGTGLSSGVSVGMSSPGGVSEVLLSSSGVTVESSSGLTVESSAEES